MTHDRPVGCGTIGNSGHRFALPWPVVHPVRVAGAVVLGLACIAAGTDAGDQTTAAVAHERRRHHTNISAEMC